MIYHEPGAGTVLRQTCREDVNELERLQIIVFPDLDDQERFKASHYLHHIAMFPEGQMLIENKGEIIGMTTTIRYHFDPANPKHTFAEMITGGYCYSHQPDGDWLYGLDIGIHPQYRGKGYARALYQQRFNLVKKLGLCGEVTVGMLNGYGQYKDLMPAEEYYIEVCQGKRFDPTVSVQMKAGFTPNGLIEEYVNDPTCGNYGVLLLKKFNA
ncbi:MAG: GNAT family N-acetyltransferase [Cyclobacteriaceae bacterium]|nr:GNAT family N-acetyltransferase [Cyclobacteriaceae bacterium]